MVIPPDVEGFQSLVESKVQLLGGFAQATQTLDTAWEAEDFLKVRTSIRDRQDIIERVRALDKKIGEALFVLKMECISSQDHEGVESALKQLEDTVAQLVVGEQECLTRVRATYDTAKAEIIAMQSQRKGSQGYAPPRKPAPSRFVDSQS